MKLGESIHSELIIALDVIKLGQVLLLTLSKKLTSSFKLLSKAIVVSN